MSEEKNKVYYRKDRDLQAKLNIFMKKEGYANAKVFLVDKSDGKGIFAANFTCGECEACKKKMTCQIADDPPTQEELDASESLFTKIEIDKEKKNNDPMYQLLKKYLKPDVFL